MKTFFSSLIVAGLLMLSVTPASTQEVKSPLTFKSASTFASDPLSTNNIAIKLLEMSNGLQAQGRTYEADILNKAAAKIALGEPPARKGKKRIIPCDTDTDCMKKNGGNGGPETK